jgi:hypothetical protein
LPAKPSLKSGRRFFSPRFNSLRFPSFALPKIIKPKNNVVAVQHNPKVVIAGAEMTSDAIPKED